MRQCIKNVMEELKKPKDEAENDDPVMDDYDLIAYSKMRVDFEYIVRSRSQGW